MVNIAADYERQNIVNKMLYFHIAVSKNLLKTQDKNNYLPEISSGVRHSVYFIKLTLPILHTIHDC